MTAVQQEITRAHKHENWALDSVVLHAEVTEIENADSVKGPPKVQTCSNINAIVISIAHRRGYI